MKKLINTDKILILALVATFLSFLKFVISVSIGNNFTPIFDVSIIDICILIILYIYEELIELQKGNKKSVEETEVKEHEENKFAALRLTFHDDIETEDKNNERFR